MLQIRPTTTADEDTLTQIRRAAILTLAVAAMSTAEAEKWAIAAAPDRVARAIREHDVWVAVQETAIGWVEVNQDRIAALYVSPSYARRGVGSALLAHAETAIGRAGYPTARLAASPNALAFYLRRGYLQIGLPDADNAYPLYKDLTPTEELHTHNRNPR